MDNSRNLIEKNFLNIEKKDFDNLLKERGDKTETIPIQPMSNREKIKVIQTKKIIQQDNKNIGSSVINTHQSNFEYDYSDEELKEDDRKIKEEYNQIAAEYKKTVIFLKSFFSV